MKKLSLCMIVKNEQEVIARCLDSVKNLFDEIVVVDTGSTDSTKEIVLHYTNNIYDFKWENNFSKARNFSFSKATGDYIMWLDADDVVSPENLQKLLDLKQELNGYVDCYMLKYAIAFNQENKPTFIYYRERIIKNDGTFFWNDPVHEAISPHGKIQYLDITIYHKKTKPSNPERNLKIYQSLISSGASLTPRQKFYYARELFYNAKYQLAIENFTEYLTYYTGWVENKIEACLTMCKCHLLLNQPEQALSSLFKSFNYDLPRAEILCEIGNLYMQQKQYKNAIYYLNLALKSNIDIKSGAFVLPECYNVVPHLQLCVCYFHLGNIKQAEKHNLYALKYNPENVSANLNKKIFEKIRLDKQKK